MKKGDKVRTPYGFGEITSRITKKTKQVLVFMLNYRFWPHWDIFYNIEELKPLKTK